LISSDLRAPCFDMAPMSALLVLSAVALVHGGIHPDGHWDRCSELTPDSADNFVKENVDAGKTVFIRWIASEG